MNLYITFNFTLLLQRTCALTTAGILVNAHCHWIMRNTNAHVNAILRMKEKNVKFKLVSSFPPNAFLPHVSNNLIICVIICYIA